MPKDSAFAVPSGYWPRWLGLFLVLGFIVRLISLWIYPQHALWPQWQSLFYLMANDLQAWLLLSAVIVFGVWLGIGRIVASIILGVALVLVVVEVFFWMEFESRPDRLVFHYLSYPKEVLAFLEEQFFLSIVLLPFLLMVWLFQRWIGPPPRQPDQHKMINAIPVAAALVIWFATPLGQTHSRTQTEFVSNGYLSVLNAARYRADDVPWLEAEHFNTPATKASRAPLLQEVAAELGDVKHVMLIIEESFSGPVWVDPTLRQKFLPNFTSLAAESVSFERLYATGSRTTRGMEALLNGFPPLPGISATERAEYRRLPSVARF